MIAVPTTPGVAPAAAAGVDVTAAVMVVFAVPAFAGATDRTPAPNAVTATSAMRL